MGVGCGAALLVWHAVTRANAVYNYSHHLLQLWRFSQAFKSFCESATYHSMVMGMLSLPLLLYFPVAHGLLTKLKVEVTKHILITLQCPCSVYLTSFLISPQAELTSINRMPILALLYLRTSTLCASSPSVIKWPTPIVLLRKLAAPEEHGWLRSVGPVRLRRSIVNQSLKLSRCLWIPPPALCPLRGVTETGDEEEDCHWIQQQPHALCQAASGAN